MKDRSDITGGRKEPMRIQYRFVQLSKNQKELLETVLWEEMEIQHWFSIAFSASFGREIFFPLQ
jgi:hypothetical protein